MVTVQIEAPVAKTNPVSGQPYPSPSNAATVVARSSPWPPYSTGTGNPSMPNRAPLVSLAPELAASVPASGFGVAQLFPGEICGGFVPMLLCIGKGVIHNRAHLL